MLVFTPQSHFHRTSLRDLQMQQLADNAARGRHLYGPMGDYYYSQRPSYLYPTYDDLEEARAREYYRREEAARRTELARQIALERHWQEQMEQQNRRQRYLVELERRGQIEALRRARNQGYSWFTEQEQLDEGRSENISPTSIPVRIIAKSPTPEASPEQKEKAASIIQSAYRTFVFRRSALKALDSIRTSFKALASSFVFPSHPSFDSTSDSHSYKLSYNSVNAPIHVYEEGLMKLLSKLDSIESKGDSIVRKQRKQLAKEIESELSRLDRDKEEAWEAQRVEVQLQAEPLRSVASTIIKDEPVNDVMVLDEVTPYDLDDDVTVVDDDDDEVTISDDEDELKDEENPLKSSQGPMQSPGHLPDEPMLVVEEHSTDQISNPVIEDLDDADQKTASKTETASHESVLPPPQ